MSKILFINDIHFSDKPPVNRKDTYLDDLFAKIEDCKRIAENVDGTILTGDVFHQPRANAVSHSLVSRVINVFRDWPTPIMAIAGNHDMPEAGFKAIEKQPLYVLKNSGVIDLRHQSSMWMQDKTTCIQFFSYDTNNLDKYKLKRPKNCKHHILVCHDMIMPEGDYPYEYISQEWIADNADYDAVFWGHIHHDLGTRKVRNTLFTSAGSLVRISRSTENRNRQMRVAILNVEETLSVDFATLTSARSFDDVFIFNEFSTKGKEKYSEYIDKIASFQLDSTDIDTYLTNLQESDTLKNKVREYIYA